MFNKIQCGGEHVAAVIGTKLLAGDAEGRTRDTSSQKVNARKILMPNMAEILLDYVPMRPVFSEGGAILRLIFNCGGMMEASHLKTEGLTTTTCAKFKDSKTHLYRFDIIRRGTASEDGRYRAIL